MNDYLRSDLKDLKPYRANVAPYRIKMDANESPFDMPDRVRKQLAEELLAGSGLNLYPDSDATGLRKSISEYCNVHPDEIIVGAGSDELIQVIINALVDRGEAVLYPSPSFGMYGIFTRIAGGIPLEVALKEDFCYDVDGFYKAIELYKPKLIFICSPNNPTGNILELNKLEELTKNFSGVVAVDEAYGEFCEYSAVELIEQCPNIVVLKTFSKAMGLAGLRVGYLIANKGLVDQINAVKPPYNVSSFSQRAAQLVLENMDIIRDRISKIINERERLYTELNSVGGVHVYPSKANFLLIRVNDADEIYEKLTEEGILVRNFPGNQLLKDCLRITVGTSEDNDIFLKTLKQILPSIR
ncbi:MAG: histidinol-phosphate transaminase [Clostridiales bacterium]|jgi:histidinol-phosphate aminotransferase|nr:histidinol-phosphate transaminase [Clostridiales bacterium]